MMSQLMTFLNALGLSANTIKIIVIIAATGGATHFGTKILIKESNESAMLIEVKYAVDSLNKKLDYKFENIDNSLISVESAINNLSTFNEKSSIDNMDFMKAYVQDNARMMEIYEMKITRLEELKKDYLPTRNNFSIGVRKLEKTN